MFRWIICFVLLYGIVAAEAGQPPQEIMKVRNFREKNEKQILAEFFSLLSLPNIASNLSDIQKNAAFIQEMMRRRGISPELLSAGPDAPPVVFGEWKVPNAKRTILLYAHYDGQPVSPEQWTTTQPWAPVITGQTGGEKLTANQIAGLQAINPEGRVHARSASDDKGGVMAILTGFEALQANQIALTSNIKFFFEGEEEEGSSNLDALLKKYSEKLKSDVWIVCDGPVHQSGIKQVVFGVRGDTNVDVTVYGAIRPLHSGHYGNWAPNPAMRLAQLLASMKNASGTVLIDGWYDDVEPLTETEKKAIADAPQYDEELKRKLVFSKPDGEGKSYLDLIQVPSLNINGFASGDVGDRARNVIPTTATAVLDLRLVKGNDYQKQVNKLIRHIEKQGYHVLDRDPNEEERMKYSLIAKVIHRSGGYNAQRTTMDLAISKQVIDAVQTTSAVKIVTMPTLGGSLPLSIVTENLAVPAITVPIANFDNNQHAENENIRIQNLWDGIETMASLMIMK